jgi:RimJ/RimL family protein N-acetyltransferase
MNEMIVLRELERADLAALTRWRADYSLVRLLGGSFRHIGSEVDSRWFESYLESRSNNVRLAICLAETGQIVGVVYLLQIDWINRSAEFSIQIGEPSAQGRGIGEEATRIALRHAFADLNLRRVYLTVLAGNQRAQSLYEKVGFRAEGLFRAAAYKDGQYVDLIPMAILRDEANR